MKVVVGVSNRHIHITKEDFEKLFGEADLTVKNLINQPGQFAANETVTIKSVAGEFENVRIVGPFRSYTQVEISKTDTFKLKINPPIRTSGDLEGASPITIVGPKGSITLNNAVIIADRHLHIAKDEALKLGLKNNDKIKAIINNEKAGIMEINVKVSEEAFFCIDLDTDDANAFLIANGDEIEIEI